MTRAISYLQPLCQQFDVDGVRGLQRPPDGVLPPHRALRHEEARLTARGHVESVRPRRRSRRRRTGNPLVLLLLLDLLKVWESNTLVIGYCDYHPVTRISAFDTILPIANRAKNAILLF